MFYKTFLFVELFGLEGKMGKYNNHINGYLLKKSAINGG